MYKIDDFTPGISSQTKQRASIFLRMAADKIVDTARPNTPKRDNYLNKDVLTRVTGLHGEVEWRKEYASYQEAGQRRDGSRKVKNYTTPGTGPHFAENAVKEVVANSGGILRASRLI